MYQVDHIQIQTGSKRCNSRTYLELPVIEFPTWRIIISRIDSDPNVGAVQPAPIVVAFGDQSVSVFFGKRVCNATRNNHHLEAGTRTAHAYTRNDVQK